MVDTNYSILKVELAAYADGLHAECKRNKGVMNDA